MLNKAKTMKGYKLNGLDGELGTVEEFYFDDRHWTVRYLVANTGTWLSDRQVLISPYALGFVNVDARVIGIDLTKKQIDGSPSLDSDKPVSRQFETDYYKYYGWPLYWGGPNMWGNYPYIAREREKCEEAVQAESSWDPHLRSVRDVTGHHIQATDGEIGHVEDFIIDDNTWAIRYLVVDTRNWWPGKRILVSPRWIERVSWSEDKVFVNLPRETIKEAPAYTEQQLTRDYESELHGHYKRQGYWVDEPPAK